LRSSRSFWRPEGMVRERMGREGKWAVDRTLQAVEGILSLTLKKIGATERF